MNGSESINPALLAESAAVNHLRRLGRNLNGYRGETIDVDAVLSECRRLARASGWEVEDLDPDKNFDLPAFHRRGQTPDSVRIYVSAGIHGDEPAGPLAIRQMFVDDLWPACGDFWVCPCLNPTGFVANRRENNDGADLNRQYLRPQAKEIIAHIAWLERQPRFDLCLCLHEDWESNGFYLYELNPDGLPTIAGTIMSHVATVCPIDRSEVIDGRAARAGIIRPTVELALRPDWPEAFFLLMHKTRLSYTLEAPSDFDLGVRVNGLVVATRTAIEATLRNQIRPPEAET